MDGNKKSSKMLPHIVVVASTSRVDAIDPALRRAGRFDSEVEVAVPTVEERLLILMLYAKNLHLDEKVDLQTVAAFCNGYVAADLEALCREAAKLAYHRMLNISEGDKVLELHMEDRESARSMVGPSITRGVTKEISTVSCDDIGGLKNLKWCRSIFSSMLEKVKLCYVEHFKKHVLLLQALYFSMRLMPLPPRELALVGILVAMPQLEKDFCRLY